MTVGLQDSSASAGWLAAHIDQLDLITFDGSVKRPSVPPLAMGECVSRPLIACCDSRVSNGALALVRRSAGKDAASIHDGFWTKVGQPGETAVNSRAVMRGADQ